MRLCLLFIAVVVATTTPCPAMSEPSTCNSSSWETQTSGSGAGAASMDTDTLSYCNPWSVRNGNMCRCGDSLDEKVLCNELPSQLKILTGYCMTLDETSCSTVAGSCPYSFIRNNKATVFLSVPINTSDLNEYMCGPLHREGLLCSHCQEGYYPAVYSYDYTCTPCDGSNGYNWLLFLASTLLPTTVLFLVLILFRVNVNAPPLSVLILFSQISSSPEIVRLVPSVINSTTPTSPGLFIMAQIMFVFHGIWSLDFFPLFVFPDYCLPGVSKTLYAIALQYIVAFYPLFLVSLVFVCIRLHYLNFKPVVLLWRPFHKCFAKWRRTWDVNASIINAFATFLLLSYWKIMYTSFSLLLLTVVHTVLGDILDRRFYYDASLKYMHEEHLPFAILAILITVLVVAPPPILLFFYPLKIFHNILSALHIRRHSLIAFMDLFQGHYRVRADGKRDWRWFSCVYFLVRIIILAARVSVSRINAYPIITILLVIVSLLVAVLRPYKEARYCYFDSIVLALLAGLHFTHLWVHWVLVQTDEISLWLVLPGYVEVAIPLVIYTLLIFRWFDGKWTLRQKCKNLWRVVKRRCISRSSIRVQTEESFDLRVLGLNDLDTFVSSEGHTNGEPEYHDFD